MWLLFGFAATGPLGGMSDLAGAYSTIDDVVERIRSASFREHYAYYSVSHIDDIVEGVARRNVTTFAVSTA
jgi:hypothetical protein